MNKKILLPMLTGSLILVLGAFSFFFIRMGINDSKALSDFPIAYNNYDQAITGLSNVIFTTYPENAANIDNLERKANEALVALRIKASVRISSLTRNDGSLMNVSLEIADNAGKELDTLVEYQKSAANPTDMNRLATHFHDLMVQRQADYALYQELAAINK